MNEREEFDTAIIATDVKTHMEIASFFLTHGKNVMIEKPVVSNKQDLNEQYRIAEENSTKALALFHWQYADEIIYLKDHITDFGTISRIEVEIHDDYLESDGSVRLNNSWRYKDKTKTTRISCSRGTVTVIHSEQKVYINDRIVFDRPSEDRLAGHYINMFYADLSAQKKDNVKALYKYLFG